MTAPTLPTAAVSSNYRQRVEVWHRAAAIRDEWLDWGLSTKPADRTATETALTNIYARLGRSRPQFIWVDSPRAALPLVAGLPTLGVLHEWVMSPPTTGRRPFASDLVAGLSRLRGALGECITKPDFDPKPPKLKDHEKWPRVPPLDGLAFGTPFVEVLRQHVLVHLENRLARGLYRPIRAALGIQPVCWYGQQESYWIAYFDVWRRLGLAQYPRNDDVQFDDWATLARSCGWWWPDENRCVIVERPAAITPAPLSVEYRDSVILG